MRSKLSVISLLSSAVVYRIQKAVYYRRSFITVAAVANVTVGGEADVGRGLGFNRYTYLII